MGLFYIKSFVFLSKQHAYGEVAYKNDMHYTPNYIFELIGKIFKKFKKKKYMFLNNFSY